MIAFLILSCLVLGLWLFRMPWPASLILLLIGVGFAFYRFKGRGLLIFVLATMGGWAITNLDRIEPPNQETYRGFVVSSKENYFLIQSGAHKFYVQEDDNHRELGDYLEIDGYLKSLSFPTYESRFDFQGYLNDKGVFHELRVLKTEVLFTNPLRLNARKDAFLNNFDDMSADAIDALLFSRKNYEAEMIQNAEAMNILFLFSMCGIYLRLAMSICEYFLKLKLTDKAARITTLILLLPLFLLGLEKMSTQRLFLSYGGRIINDYFLKKKVSYLTLLSTLALGFLALDFHAAFSLAFLLGFGLSALIVFLRSAMHRFKRKYRRLMMGLFIFLFLVPIHLSMSAELHFLQILFQYLALPLNAFFFFAAATSFYTWPMRHLLPFLARLMTSVYAFLRKVDIVMIVGEPPLFLYFVYYGLYFYIPYLLESHRQSDAKKVAVALSSCLVLAALPIHNYLGEAIHFINVGQGDAILVQTRGKNVLIDTGGNKSFDMAIEVLIPFFKKKRVYQIDYLITTHDDFDHCGAAPSLIENFRVEHRVTNAAAFPLALGNVTFRNLNDTLSADENDNSLVLTFTLLDKEWLLMGDASKAVEERIISRYSNLDIDYLKIGHHGSNTSTDESFLRHITPEEAIISVGSNNYYGHPHQEVIALLHRYDITIRRTDLEGTISYSSALF